MNLIIDQGNTRTKVAIFDINILLDVFVYNVFDTQICQSLLQGYNIRRCIYSTVIEPDTELISYLTNKVFSFIFFDESTKLPISNCYKSPATLGKDRIAAAVAAKDMYQSKFVMVIDAGTAITYEFVDEIGTYLGGNISPGISLRFKALNEFTGKLPLIDKKGSLPQIGYDTKTAIRSGVLLGIIAELDSYIDEYKLRYPNFELILTGGDAIFLESKLKNNTFVDENLVLKGLNRILNYNVDE